MANLKLWSLRLLTFVTSVAFFATAPVYGATTQCQPGQLLKTGAVGTVVAVGPTGDCTDPLNPLPSVWSFWSNPNVFVNGNGVLTWSAQANRPVSASCSTEVGIDRWFSATYNPGTNAWTPPAASACADLQGAYSRAPYSPTNPGPLGDSDVVKVGSKYYMAFNGGNADFIVGQVYWATSNTGLPGSWNIYNSTGSQPWIPLIRDRYHDGRDGIPEPIGSFPWRIPGGFTETHLAYDPTPTAAAPSGYFYLYLGHYGLLQELDEDGQPPLDQWLNDIDSWAVRIPYNPSNTYGISTQKEIWHLGQWREFDSGQLVWDFDTLGNPVPLEPIVSVGQGENGANRFFPGGGGALRQDPTTGQWLHAYWFAGVTYSQTSTSLADNYWTSSATVCMDTVQALVPAGTTSNPDIFEPGLYHGVLGNRTGWWMFSPVNHLGCAAVYIGAGIVPAELCTTAPPALNVVAPSSGADGSPVTITGTGLDCAGSVKFDGVAAQIQSRAAGLLNVIAPAHLPGAVNVVVTTAGGTATKTNGFIYLPKVSIEATDAAAAESPLDTGKFRLTRTGSTASPLTVTITRGGSATNGSDYNSISTAQTIAQGSLTRDITVTPINDTAVEPPESVVLTVATGSGYVPGSPGSATVTIASDDGTTVSIAATDPTASESPTTTGQFLLTRTGSTTSPLTVTLARGGSATNVSDYASISTSQTIPAGQFTKTIDVLPVNDTLVEPAETVVLTVAAAAGYVVGSPSVATVAISSEDSCVPNATTLCLVDGRFKATLTASTPQGQKDGKAITYPGSNKAGWFWLFLPLQLPEEGVKILDNGVGGFSVTYGASTDNATVLSVEDLTTGTVETFEKLASTFCGDSEAQAFSLEIPADGGGADLANPETEFFACAPDGTTACLLGGRFQVRVKVNNVAKPTTGITEQSASFRLSTATEPDVWVNLIDGFPANQRFWVYFGSLTNQAYTVEVTDSSTSALKTYSRNVGEAWCGGGDNTAFPSP